MAKEHHCPKCGAQPCVASTSKIHTCGVCASIWEEDLSAPVAVSVPAKSPTPAPSAPAPVAAPPKPAVPVTTPPKPAPAAAPAPATASAAPTPQPLPTPSPPAAPAPVPKPPAAPATPSPLLAPSVSPAASGAVKRLADVLPEAKVKRCPACQSDGVALPSEYAMVQGRLVLVDSQTYRAHRWYADTGELLPEPVPPARPPAAPVPGARTTPAT